MRLICGQPILLVRIGIKVERARQWVLRGFRPRRRGSQTAAKWPLIVWEGDRRAPDRAAAGVPVIPEGDPRAAQDRKTAEELVMLARMQGNVVRPRIDRRGGPPARATPKPARYYWS